MEMPTFLSMEGAIRNPSEVDNRVGTNPSVGYYWPSRKLVTRLNPLKDKPDGEGKELDLNPLDYCA